MKNDARLKQCSGIFELPPAAEQELTWELDITLPDEWSVGAIVGPSGSGKSTIAREIAAMFGTTLVESLDAEGNLREPFEWDRERAICSHLPAMGIREWTGLLSRVGFSSPPAWLRPYQALSLGQKFRVNLARSIAEASPTRGEGEGEVAAPPIFFDEFASLVHSQAATVASAAVAKTVRTLGRRFVAVTWREDILDPLEPDWVLFCGADQSLRLELNTPSREGVRPWQRKKLALKIVRTDRSAWLLFRGHHYLNHDIHRSAACFVGLVGGEPAVFTAVLNFPHPSASCWREHRTVCAPDFQGVGLGNAMSEFVASLFVATGRPYRSTTSHPSMIAHRRRSALWRITREPSLGTPHSNNGKTAMRAAGGNDRLTAGFEYVGPKRTEEAKRLGITTAVPV